MQTENQSDEITASAARILTYFKQIDERNIQNLEDAVRIGLALRKANTLIPHSEFEGWTRTHVGLSLADAVHYMETSKGYQQWQGKQTTVKEEPQVQPKKLNEE